jgi:poly-gamma-glutamate synthesis protein (capsule biosynthesis protein)
MKLLFVGDVMLGRLVNQKLKDATAEYPWGDTLPVFRNADVRICNLECVISDRGVPWSATPKTFHFRTDAKNIPSLTSAGVNVASLANNHSLDFEYEALADTVNILDAAGIHHAGAGANIREASKAVRFRAGELSFAFIAFTDNEPDWEADESVPGVFYVPVDTADSRALRLFGIVQEAKKKADLVIVSAHWGPNWGYRPKPEHIPFAHALVESGADIVFGHSCHVFQGVEIYRGRPIFYSAGDFIDDYAVDEIERNDESFIFLVEVEGRRIARLRLHPTVISRMQVRLAQGRREEEIVEKMQDLCGGFGTEAKWIGNERCLEIIIQRENQILNKRN